MRRAYHTENFKEEHEVHADAEKVDARWFRIVKRGASGGTRLICFPHAGGSASFFQGWGRLLPAGVELLAVRYPGREDRILDPLPDAMEDLAGPLTGACSTLDSMPLAFFGHSMGALVAHEVAHRIERLTTARLTNLFVSGCASPTLDKSRRDPSALSDSDLVEDVRMLGGTNPEVLTNPELKRLFLQALRADYQLIAHHSMSPDGILQAPIAAYYGDQDEGIDAESISAWSTATKSTFSARRFTGGHFYLTHHAEDLVADICARLRAHR
jgi:pyochelin biosynthesis protein PchC